MIEMLHSTHFVAFEREESFLSNNFFERALGGVFREGEAHNCHSSKLSNKSFCFIGHFHNDP